MGTGGITIPLPRRPIPSIYEKNIPSIILFDGGSDDECSVMSSCRQVFSLLPFGSRCAAALNSPEE